MGPGNRLSLLGGVAVRRCHSWLPGLTHEAGPLYGPPVIFSAHLLILPYYFIVSPQTRLWVCVGRKCFCVRFIPNLEWCSGREGGGVELEPRLACRPQSVSIVLTDVTGNQAFPVWGLPRSWGACGRPGRHSPCTQRLKVAPKTLSDEEDGVFVQCFFEKQN